MVVKSIESGDYSLISSDNSVSSVRQDFPLAKSPPRNSKGSAYKSLSRIESDPVLGARKFEPVILKVEA